MGIAPGNPSAFECIVETNAAVPPESQVRKLRRQHIDEKLKRVYGDDHEGQNG